MGAPKKVYARAPFARIDAAGDVRLRDRANIRRRRFYNYVTKKSSDVQRRSGSGVLVHEGEVSTALGMDGMSYLEFARKALALQKSQNGGASRGRGPGAGVTSRLRLSARYGSRIPDSPATRRRRLSDGIDITLPAIASACALCFREPSQRTYRESRED